MSRDLTTHGGTLTLALATTTAIALVVAYLALGGGSYKPLEVADPCKPRRLPPATGFEQISQQLLLSGLDGAACRLRVTREELALALTSEGGRERFAREHRIRDEVLERAVREGLERAVRDAEGADRISRAEASLLRAAVVGLPIGTLIKAFRTEKDIFGATGDSLNP